MANSCGIEFLEGRRGCSFLLASPCSRTHREHGVACALARRELALAAGVSVDERLLMVVGLAPPQSLHMRLNMEFAAMLMYMYHRARHEAAPSREAGATLATTAAPAAVRGLGHLR